MQVQNRPSPQQRWCATPHQPPCPSCCLPPPGPWGDAPSCLWLPTEALQVPPGWHPMGFSCPVLFFLHPAEHPTSAGQVLHLVEFKCPTGWLSLLPQAQDVHQRVQRTMRGLFPELCMPWGALRAFSSTGILPAPPRRTWSRERGTEMQSMTLTARSDSHHDCH